MNRLKLATFRTDVTPPVGHPLCAGWMSPAIAVTDPLFAQGIILQGAGEPIVLCAIDWCEISNRSHIRWRETLARAAGTSAERVAVQCVHPHCTPWPDEEAQQLVARLPGAPPIMDPLWCRTALDRVAAAAQRAVDHAQIVTHVATGEAMVDRVASNRRVMGTDGRVKAIRWTVTKDPAVRAEPEGLIDPHLKTISFWNDQQKIAALHYYAVHNTTYDDSRVTNEFAGLARERYAAEESGIAHLYFTGCAGNLTAGKYNDGNPENRCVFAERIYRALRESERRAERTAVRDSDWRVVPLSLPPRADYDGAALESMLREPKRAKDTTWAAIQLAYRQRLDEPIPLTVLDLDGISILHLPGEPFIEYQLFAQQQRTDRFIAVAGYGDCGPGYICLEESLAEGGYEPTDSFVAPESERLLKSGMGQLLRGASAR